MTTVGILGAGQLAMMLSQAAATLGVKTLCLAASADECAGQVAPLCVVPTADPAAWESFVAQVDVLTLETENVILDLATFMSARKPLCPNLESLAVSQDRGYEKALFQSQGIRTAPYSLVDSLNELKQAAEDLGLPAILKTRRFGYDGKGQIRLSTVDDITRAWNELGKHPLILEGFMRFERELSLIGARSTQGDMAFYPLTENWHEHGILVKSEAPFLQAQLQAEAEDYMRSIMLGLDYVGVLAIEFFLVEGQLVANEMAPRVHNTGHWTIEGAKTSQFEQHIRAITGMPLGSTEVLGHSVMHNCIGMMPDKAEILSQPHAYYHDYGKAPRPGRKLGHITVVTPR
jgi:5-(carboxyamino)imidazole ribonucleotide synthase